MSVFGAPFFLGGLLLALVLLRIVPMGNMPTEWWAEPAMGLMSLAFLAVGGTLCFGRSKVNFEPGMDSLARQYSFLGLPVRTKSRRRSEFNAVEITFQLGDSDSPDRYPVRLRAIGGEDFSITKSEQFGDARTHAEFLSRFLHLPLIDATTDHEVVSTPEHAGETLQQRLRSSGAPPEQPRPAEMRSEVSGLSGETRIVIPWRRSRAGLVIAMVASGVVMFIFVPTLWRFFTQTDTPAIVRFVFIGFALVVFGLLPFMATAAGFSAFRNKTVVTVTPAGLTIELAPRKSKTTTIAAADILDVDYSTFDGILESVRRSARMRSDAAESGVALVRPLKALVPSRGIMVKTRSGIVMFGEGLPADELRYLTFLVKKTLSGR